ncbi:MAG: hypothetical protein ABIQ39_08345, partial [Ilumatobacteraceae bacterium]
MPFNLLNLFNLFNRPETTCQRPVSTTSRAASWPTGRTDTKHMADDTSLDENGWQEVRESFESLRARVRNEMGGARKVTAIHERGTRTIRERLLALSDEGTFEEVGTFAWGGDPTTSWLPGDGKIGGTGLVDGRPVTMAGD